MKLDLSKPLLDHRGKPMRETQQPDAPDATVASVAVTALLAAHPDDAKLDYAAKARRGLLAFRIEAHVTACELAAEDITEIKLCVGRLFGPLTCAALHNAIEGL
jgi:hypothetical protein